MAKKQINDNIIEIDNLTIKYSKSLGEQENNSISNKIKGVVSPNNNKQKSKRKRKSNTYSVNHVNLNLKRGQFYYIIGRSGSGKTTLLNEIHMDGADAERTGEVRLFLQNKNYSSNTIKKNQKADVRKKIGFIFQDHELSEGKSALENVARPLMAFGYTKEVAYKKAKAHLKSVNISENKFYNRPGQLSGGEKQRVGIARAVAKNPEIIIADEPTGSLDENSANEVMKVLLNLNRAGTTVLMATHTLTLVKKFPQNTIHIKNGKVVARTSRNQTREAFKKLKGDPSLKHLDAKNVKDIKDKSFVYDSNELINSTGERLHKYSYPAFEPNDFLQNHRGESK